MIPCVVAQQTLRHLTSRGIARAKNKDSLLFSHRLSIPFDESPRLNMANGQPRIVRRFPSAVVLIHRAHVSLQRSRRRPCFRIVVYDFVGIAVLKYTFGSKSSGSEPFGGLVDQCLVTTRNFLTHSFGLPPASNKATAGGTNVPTTCYTRTAVSGVPARSSTSRIAPARTPIHRMASSIFMALPQPPGQ